MIKTDIEHKDFKHPKLLNQLKNTFLLTLKMSQTSLIQKVSLHKQAKNDNDNGISSRTRSKRNTVNALHTNTVKNIVKKTDHRNLLHWLSVQIVMLFFLHQIAFWTPIVAGQSVTDITVNKRFQDTINNGGKCHMAHDKHVNA